MLDELTVYCDVEHRCQLKKEREDGATGWVTLTPRNHRP